MSIQTLSQRIAEHNSDHECRLHAQIERGGLQCRPLPKAHSGPPRGLHAISHELGKILLRAISLCSQTDTTR